MSEYGVPSEYWDYDYPDHSQPHHPAHPAYLMHHPPPIVNEAINIIQKELNRQNPHTGVE